MSDATLWWLMAGLAVAAELATGTFYLLMLAVGLAAGAVAAMLAASASVQIVVAALVAACSTAAWHWSRARHPHAAAASENPDVQLDIGGHVNVESWGADDQARVHYRGTQWSARLKPGQARRAGAHRVVAVEGNVLVVEPLETLQTH